MGVAQLVELQVVALVAAGSSPVAHPNFNDETAVSGRLTVSQACIAPVAQLDRALASEAKGRAFESRRAHQYDCGM